MKVKRADCRALYTLVKLLRKHILLLILMLLVGSVFAKEKSQVTLKSANSIKSDKTISAGAKRLIGDVVFEQDSTIMECDSAYFYSEKNMFDAFGNVHLYKLNDDNIDVKSSFLRHDGEKKMAYFRENVVLQDTQITLYTDSLDYDIANNIGYYIHGGKIVDSATTLTSVKGHYYNKEESVYFKDEVVVVHNDGEYQMYTDTLKYNTTSKVVYFFGPTEFYNDTNYMYAKYGWYNTQNNRMFMRDDAFYSNPNQTLEADSLYYDRNLEYGQAFSNVVVKDTVQHMLAKGNYVELHQYNKSLFITDSAQIITVAEGDSVYIHADTIFSAVDSALIQVERRIDSLVHGVDSLLVRDSIEMVDSMIEYRYLSAYYHVKIFKSDFQVKVDSLYFSMLDSVLQFHGSPVLWAERNQITGEYIEAFLKDEKLDMFKIYKTGLIISPHKDSIHYNQIRGKEIVGYLANNELKRIDVLSISETLYFPEDEDGIIGINKANSDNITIYMKNNEPSRIVYRKDPVSNTHPLEEMSDSEMKLKGFTWQENVRPLRPSDIFLWDSNTSPLEIKEEGAQRNIIESEEAVQENTEVE